MAKYTVRIEEVNSVEVVVEADSEQEAIDAAFEEVGNDNGFFLYGSDDVSAWAFKNDEE